MLHKNVHKHSQKHQCFKSKGWKIQHICRYVIFFYPLLFENCNRLMLNMKDLLFTFIWLRFYIIKLLFIKIPALEYDFPVLFWSLPFHRFFLITFCLPVWLIGPSPIHAAAAISRPTLHSAAILAGWQRPTCVVFVPTY